MFNFPFDVTIWGTVSDWVLTIATIVTLYFIYRTFQSQLIVQKSQLDLTQIEIDKYVKEDRPIFILKEYAFYHLESRNEDPNLIIHLKKVGNLQALNLNVRAMPFCDIEILTEDVDCISQDVTVMYFFRKKQSNFKDLKFLSMIFFKDRYDNNYRQVFTLIQEDDQIKGYLSSLSINDKVSHIFNENS
ncbi:hypothetical protein [Pedobacter chitinilyticus]|uniref:Uncharacterized protein n=1 Tax=Pedobacter chitinilyticus TaxID=2233776 RepID=A0A443Z202_9SPHI|nr:hypothetical protein [Pedobacter chitinilyticus]RWU10564.1 hypothetical protein DPV69_04290 [Pedobacter chitinilyticus]